MVNYKCTIQLPDGGALVYIGTQKMLCNKINALVSQYYHIDANMHRNKFAALLSNPKCVSKYIKNIVNVERLTPVGVSNKNKVN